LLQLCKFEPIMVIYVMNIHDVFITTSTNEQLLFVRFSATVSVMVVFIDVVINYILYYITFKLFGRVA